jgi:hypothetical protein
VQSSFAQDDDQEDVAWIEAEFTPKADVLEKPKTEKILGA